ncbi:MAG: porin family protein [Gammaproteobacteria bacterium]|nr:porin family protein [Gammaproteobacteria bacterium]
MTPLLINAEQASTDTKIFKNFKVGVSMGSASANAGNFKSSFAGQWFIESDITSHISLRLSSRGTVDFKPDNSSLVYLEYNESLIPAINIKFTNNSPFEPYIGLQYVNWDLTPRGTANTLQKVSDSGPGLVAGIKYSFLRRWAIHLEYNRVDEVDDADISFTQIGLSLQL